MRIIPFSGPMAKDELGSITALLTFKTNYRPSARALSAAIFKHWRLSKGNRKKKNKERRHDLT